MSNAGAMTSKRIGGARRACRLRLASCELHVPHRRQTESVL